MILEEEPEKVKKQVMQKLDKEIFEEEEQYVKRSFWCI